MKACYFNKEILFLCLLFSFNLLGRGQVKKVGLLIVATGKYIQFVEPLIDSANKYFCNNHEVTYFVFTDGQAPTGSNIITIYQDRLGWPHDTLMRFSMYAKQKQLLQKMDYLFACDADMLFVDVVSDEILSDRVGTLHPGYVGKKGGAYERKKRRSTAYVQPGQGLYYFAGGFNGGSSKEFLKMAKIITENILKDLSINIIAQWHDESHLNRYFIDNPPTKILSPSYCYSANPLSCQDWVRQKYKPKLVALDKNHHQLRK